MKKTVLTIALAASMATPVMAAEYVFDGNKKITDKEIQDLIAQNENVIKSQVDAAKLIHQYYKSKGLINTKFTVTKEGKILIKESTVTHTGEFADYFNNSGDINREDLAVATMRMGKYLENSGLKASIALNKKTNELDIVTKEDPDFKPTTGSATLTNSGSRYTSEYVVTGQVDHKLGNGHAINGQISKGIPLTADAEGGDMRSFGGGYEYASYLGLTNFDITDTSYEVGGDYEDFGIKGTSRTYTLSHEYQIDPKNKVIGKLSHVNSTQELLDGAMESELAYNNASVEIQHKTKGLEFSAEIERGFNGSEKFNVAPMHGEYEEDYTVVRADLKASDVIAKKYQMNFGFGLQVGSHGTPSSSKFMIGGDKRGSAFANGFTSTPNGAYAFVEGSRNYKGVNIYAGLNGATGKPVVGDSIDVVAAEVGARYYESQSKLYLDVKAAKNVGESIPGQDEHKINLVLTKVFK